MDKLQPRAIIFDLGSTLIEYESVPWDVLAVDCVESAREFLVSKKVSIPDKDEFHRVFSEVKATYRRVAADQLVEWDVPTASIRLFNELKIDFDDKLVHRFFDAYYEPIDKELFVYDDTIETLEFLSQSYGTLGLVSNTIFPERAHLGELKRFGIDRYLSFTIFSSVFRLRKPHPDIFYHASNLAGCAPSECVYVGDRYVEDIQGPFKIGMPAILKVKAGREYPDEMPEATRRIDTLAELSEHIEMSVA